MTNVRDGALRFPQAGLGFAESPLDRMANVRDHGATIPALVDERGTRVLALFGDRIAVRSLEGPQDPWFSFPEIKGFGTPTETVFLGRDSRGPAFAARFDPPAEESEADVATNDLRTMATTGAVSGADLGILAEAKGLLHWHASHRFCPSCGQPSVAAAWGWRRECTQCGTHLFPRTDPVVIMLAVEGDRCLLGRQPRFPPNMYSCLAGFLEPGETVEAAVRRELNEESGIETGAVTYLASQPWPFPASIMIGCVAVATSTAITIDPNELEDARWFSRAELRAILSSTHPEGIVCPPAMAIAHGLMQAWADVEP